MTTRLSSCVTDWRLAASCYTTVAMNCLPQADAMSLLLRCAAGRRDITLDAWLASAVPTSESCAGSVSTVAAARDAEVRAVMELAGPHRLAGLPLALEWVGAYVRENRRTFTEFLTLYKSHRSWALAPSAEGTDEAASTRTALVDARERRGDSSGVDDGPAAVARLIDKHRLTRLGCLLRRGGGELRALGAHERVHVWGQV